MEEYNYGLRPDDITPFVCPACGLIINGDTDELRRLIRNHLKECPDLAGKRVVTNEYGVLRAVKGEGSKTTGQDKVAPKQTAWKYYRQPVEVTYPDGSQEVFPNITQVALNLGMSRYIIFRRIRKGPTVKGRFKGYKFRFVGDENIQDSTCTTISGVAHEGRSGDAV